MKDYKKYKQLSPTAYADGLDSNQFMDISIKGIWSNIPRIAGPAFTVKLLPGDNLMFHMAIYEAPSGSIIVAGGGGLNYAVAGGNVCAIAQKRGIKGFIIDGVIRDLVEIRDSKFPVFARGIRPKPGSKKYFRDLNKSIVCGGVLVNPTDIIIADEEGIAVVPNENSDKVYDIAKKRDFKDKNETLNEWQKNHYKKITNLIADLKMTQNQK